jgi:hypothetical protein
MSNFDKRALREAAETATPGPWVEKRGEVTTADYEVEGATYLDLICNCEIVGTESPNAEFIAAANPATVLALLDELEAKGRMVAELLNIISRHAVELGWGEKPITLAELIISREGSGSDALDAIRAAAAGKGDAS